jgi:hypothetical protein
MALELHVKLQRLQDKRAFLVAKYERADNAPKKARIAKMIKEVEGRIRLAEARRATP